MDDSTSSGNRQVAELDLQSQAPSSVLASSQSNTTNSIRKMETWNANELQTGLSKDNDILQKESNFALNEAIPTDARTEPFVDEQTKSGIASIANGQTKSDLTLLDSLTGSDTRPIADEQMESDIAFIADDQTGAGTAFIADDQLKCDRASNADELMECDEPLMAHEQTESTTARLADEHVESDEPNTADKQTKSDANPITDDHLQSHTVPIGNKQIESTKPLIADEEMESDLTHEEDQQMESAKPLIADNQKKIDASPVTNDQVKCHEANIGDKQIESNRPHIADKVITGDQQIESNRPHIADKVITGDQQIESNRPHIADNVITGDQQMESDNPIIVDSQVQSHISPIAGKQIESTKPLIASEEMESDSTPIGDQQMESDKLLIADEWTESDLAFTADDHVKSNTAPIADEQMETDKPLIANEQMEDEETESGTIPIVDEQTKSDPGTIVDEQSKYQTTLNADEKMKNEAPLFVDERMRSGTAPVALITQEPTEVDTAQITDEMNCDTSSIALEEREFVTAPSADVLTEFNTAPIEDEMKSDTTPDAVEKTESATASNADEQTNFDTALIADEMESDATPDSSSPNTDGQKETNSALFIDEPEKSGSALRTDEQIVSDTTPNPVEEIDSMAPNADQQTESRSVPFEDEPTKYVTVSITDEQTEIGTTSIPNEMESDTFQNTFERTESVTAPDADEQKEFNTTPISDEPMKSSSALIVDEPLQSVTAPSKDKHIVSDTTPIAVDKTVSSKAPNTDGLPEFDTTPIADEAMKSGSSLLKDKPRQSVIASITEMESDTTLSSDGQAICNPSLKADSQTESDAPLIDSQTESDAPLIIDEPYAAEMRGSESTLQQSHASDEQFAEQKDKHMSDLLAKIGSQTDSSCKMVNIAEEGQVDDAEEKMNGIMEETMLNDQSAENKMYHEPLVTRSEGIVLVSTQFEDGEDDSAIVVQEQRSVRQLAASQIVDSILDEPTKETCNAEDTNSNVSTTNQNRGSVLRMDLQGGTAIIDHIPNFRNSVGTPTMKCQQKSKRPSPEGQSTMSKKKPRFDEESGKRSETHVESSLRGVKDVDQSTCDKVPATLPKRSKYTPRISRIQAAKGPPRFVKIVTDPKCAYPLTSIALTPSVLSPTSVSTTSTQIVPPQTSASTVPVTARFGLPPTNISSVPNASTGLVPPVTSVSSVLVVSTQSTPPLTNVSSVPLASTQFVPPPISESTVPIPSVRLVLPPTLGNTIPMAPVQPIPPQTSLSTFPVVSTGFISAPMAYTYSSVDVPAATPRGPAQPLMGFQVAPIIENQMQPVPNPPHCPGILHLQYNQLPPHISQGNQVISPSSTFLQNCHGLGGQQCIQQASAVKPSLASTIFNPQASVQNAFGQYQQTANATILSLVTNKPVNTNPHTSSCPVTDHAPSTGYKATTPVTVQQAPQLPRTAENSSGSYTSANSVNTTQKKQQPSRKFEFTSIRIAVPTTMPAWVLVNPHKMTTSTSSDTAVATSSNSIHPKVESQTQREVSSTATAQVRRNMTRKSPVVHKQANINSAGVKRTHEDVAGDQSKRPRTMSEREMLVGRLQKVSAHRLHVVLEVLQFVTSHRFGSLYNPAVRDLTSEEVHAFSVLFAAVYGYRIYSEVQIKRIINEVAALTIHEIGTDEPRRVQEAVNSFGDVGLAKSEKLNRLSQILFTDYERAFCSATGKSGFAPFCKSRLFVLRHAYLHTIGDTELTHMVEEERMKHVLDSTANLLRIQMTQEGGYTDSQRVRDWMSKEQARVRTMLSKQQKELADQRQLARKASVSRNYLIESHLGCYVMTASEHRMLEDACRSRNKTLTKKEQMEHLLETILSPAELILIAKKTGMSESSAVCVKLAFLRQSFFAICYGESTILTSPIDKLESVKEWLSGRILLIEILDRIEAKAATIRCVMLPSEVRMKSHRLQNELKENVRHGCLTTERECEQEAIRSAQGTEKSSGFVNMFPQNLGAYVMSKVIAVHLDVVKEIADRRKRESILQHILNKIITEESNISNQPTHPRSVQMYLAFLRQCIFMVFSHDTHEVQCEIWKRCTRYMASVLESSADELTPSGVLREVQEKTQEKLVNTVTVKEENAEHTAYSFLGCPCRKEELGATVLNVDEVSEINHIKDNIQESSDSHTREVAMNELVTNLINQEDISSVPVCLALRKLPFKILKLTKLRLSYFYLFPPSSWEAEEREWAQCWSFLTRSVQSIMQNNRRFISLISVPRTLNSRMNTTDQNDTYGSDDDSSQSGEMSESSDSSSSSDEKTDEDRPLFIRTGAVKNDYAKRWSWEKRHTDRLPPSTRVAETESGRRVPLPLGAPMPLDKIGSHVMSSKEENWKENLKRTCHTQMLSKEQVVQLIVKELYTQDDIIYIHNLKRNKKSAFCPLKMAILRQVYFELFDEGILGPLQLWSHCWAHLAHVVDKIRQKARNTLLDKVVLTDKYKRLKKLQIRKAKLQQEYEKKHMKKRTCNSHEQAGQPKMSRAKSGDIQATSLNVNVTSECSSSASRFDPSIEDDVPFFVKSGATDPVHVRGSDEASSRPLSKSEETARPYTVITEKGETVILVYGKPVDESKLGAYVMTQEEANWTQALTEACRVRSIDKDDIVEFITQNVYTVPEIRRLHQVKRQKQMVFNRMKITIIRQVYYSVYPPASNKKADQLWLSFWAYFTRACQNLGKNGRSLPSAASKLGEPQTRGIPRKGALSEPKVGEAQFTLRPHFMRLLQCYSWNPDILVRFLASNIFTEDELLGCAGNLKSLDATKMKVYEAAYSQFYDPANSAASCSLIEHIHELQQATSSDFWGRQTTEKIQIEVENCAKQCGYTFSSGETNQEQLHTDPACTSTEKSTFSSAERSKMCKDILDEDFKNLPQYKFERCVYVACKLIQKMFSREELLTGNTAGTRGLCTLDPKRIAVLKCTTFAIAGVAPSAHQRTWDRIHLDIDQTIKAKGSHFLTEDRRVEKELECATVLISSKSRSLSQKQESETGFQMISCTSLIPSVLRRDLLLCAEDHTEVLKKLMNHFMHKDEDYDQFLSRAPSKMKLVRAVYWSICSISIDKLGESWIEALKTISNLVEKRKLYEKTTINDNEIEENAESIDSEDESTQLPDKIDQPQNKSTHLENKSKLQQLGCMGDVKDTSIRLMKCYNWSKEIVVRLLIQHFLTEIEFDKGAQNNEMHENKRRVIEDAFSQVYGEEEKDQCWPLIKQIIEDVCKESRSSLCSVWTRKSKKTAVEEAACATLFGKARSDSQSSGDLDCKAFIQEEFPWLPSGEVGKCLFISDHMRKCFFSTEELAFGSCTGSPGWLQLDPKRLNILKHVVFAVASVHERKKEALWQMCRNLIDKKNRKLRKQILEDDEKVESLIQTNSRALEEQIPDDIRGHVMQSKDNAVTVIRSLVQQLFNPEDLMGDADEMTPSQMKLLKELFFKIHEVVPTAKEEAWIQAMRTINYLNKISGYTFKSGDDGDSSYSFTSDKDEDWTGGMDDYPEGGESSDEDMTTKAQDGGSIPSKEKAHSESVDASLDMKPKSTGQCEPTTDPGISRNSDNSVAQHSGTCSSAEKVNLDSGITEESLDWYILKPVLAQLYKHLKAYKLEEDEIIDELIMHIFGAKLLDGKSAVMSLDESIEMLKSAFVLLYNVPGKEQAAANDLLEERLMHTLMILGQQLTQNMDGTLVEDETTVKVLNKPKPYPSMSDLEEKIKKMRSLMMESFRADERVEMDSAKLKKLKGSKVDAVIDAFQKSFPSQGTMDRKTVMTLIYNLTVELQELVTEKLRYKVDSLTDAYVERAVSALEAKAKEQATSASSATPLFQAVIQELVGVQRAVGLVPMVRVLLRYLFTPEELVLLQQSDMTQLPPSLQVQMNLMQRTVFKVMKTPMSERENAWSCIQWIIVKEITELKSWDEESNKKKIRSEMFVPVYNRCSVMKCVTGIILSLDEQSQFHADPQRFEMSHPERIREMKDLYFQIRNIQEHAKDEEWELVCTPKKNYEVAQQFTFPHKCTRERKGLGLGTSKKTVTSPTLEDKSDFKPNAGKKLQVHQPKSEKKQIQKPKKISDVMRTEGEKPDDIMQSQITTRSKAKEASKTYISILGAKKDKSVQQEKDQRTVSTNPPSTNTKPPVAVQHKKTIVVLVDYSICDRVCKIMSDEESKKNENVTDIHEKGKECETASNIGSPITNTSQTQDGDDDIKAKVDSSVQNSPNGENADKVISNPAPEKNLTETEETSSINPVRHSQEGHGNEQDLSNSDSTGCVTQNGFNNDIDTRRSKDVDQIEVAVSMPRSAVENVPSVSDLHNDAAYHSKENRELTLDEVVKKNESSTLVRGKKTSDKLNSLSSQADNPDLSQINDISLKNDHCHIGKGSEDSMEMGVISAAHIEPNDDDLLGNGNEDDAFSELDDDLLEEDSDRELQKDEVSETWPASSDEFMISEQSMSDSGKDPIPKVRSVGLARQHSENKGTAHSSNSLCHNPPSADTPIREEPASSESKGFLSSNPSSDGTIKENSNFCPTENSEVATDKVISKDDATNVCNNSRSTVENDDCSATTCLVKESAISAQKLCEEKATAAVKSQGAEYDGENEKVPEMTDNPGSKGPQAPPNSNVDILLWAAEVENKHEQSSDVGNEASSEAPSDDPPSDDPPSKQERSEDHGQTQSDSNPESNVDILLWAAQVKGSTDSAS